MYTGNRIEGSNPSFSAIPIRTCSPPARGVIGQQGPDAHVFGAGVVEIGFDVVEVVGHERGGAVAVAPAEGVDDEAVLVAGAAGGTGAAVEGDHQGRARDELPQEPRQDLVAGEHGDHQMKVARGADLGAPGTGTTGGDGGGFFRKMARQGGEIVGADPCRREPREARLDQAAGGEHLPRLVRGRPRHEGAAVALQRDDAVIGEGLQGRAHDRPARTEGGADLVLHQLGPGREAPVDDRVVQRVANGVGARGRRAVVGGPGHRMPSVCTG